jgi:integrase
MGQPEAWKIVRRIAARAALDGAGEVRPHSLRVAFITGARKAGVPLEDVQDAAGHADPRTSRRYDRGPPLPRSPRLVRRHVVAGGAGRDLPGTQRSESALGA